MRGWNRRRIKGCAPLPSVEFGVRIPVVANEREEIGEGMPILSGDRRGDIQTRVNGHQPEWAGDSLAEEHDVSCPRKRGARDFNGVGAFTSETGFAEPLTWRMVVSNELFGGKAMVTGFVEADALTSIGELGSP